MSYYPPGVTGSEDAITGISYDHCPACGSWRSGEDRHLCPPAIRAAATIEDPDQPEEGTAAWEYEQGAAWFDHVMDWLWNNCDRREPVLADILVMGLRAYRGTPDYDYEVSQYADMIREEEREPWRL